MNYQLVMKSLIVCCLLLLVVNFSIGIFKKEPAFYEFFNNQIPSQYVMRDLLDAYDKQPEKKIVIMGDSVMYGSGLFANGIKKWREATIPAYLRHYLPQYKIVDLSLDGCLLPDFLELYRYAKTINPEWIIIDLNYRMFASKYQTSESKLSRKWLGNKELISKSRFDWQMVNADYFMEVGRKYSDLFRYAESLRGAVFFPSREERMNMFLKKILPSDNWQESIDNDVLLKLKIKPYYFSPELDEKVIAIQTLINLVRQLKNDHQKFIIFYTPQNLAFIEEVWEEASFRYNIQFVNQIFQSEVDQNQYHYYDWTNKYTAESFWDHCHLTPEFNRDMARELSQIIQ
jgi:hypothetical protein